MSEDLSHLGGSGPHGDPYTFTPDLWAALVKKYGIESVVDVGCARGVNARWFFDQGLNVLGIEGFPDYVAGSRLPSHCVIEHDYADGPLPLNAEFDMALCTEFVEHVEAQYVANFLATFAACRYVLLGFATPGQGGHHHVNEQEEPYWEAQMKTIGFTLDRAETSNLRRNADWTPYGRRTLTWFKRHG